MDYNATITLGQRAQQLTETNTDKILDHLIDFSPALSPGALGHVEIVITLQASNLQQALRTATMLAKDLDPIGLEVILTSIWDARQDATPLPSLLSVTEVSAHLHVSRQAILQRIESGSLPATRVGNGWGIPARAL